MNPRPLAASRAARLRRGVNLSHWFSQVYREPGYVPAHFDSYIGVSDFALIRDMGFDHVRFAIACEPILAAAVGGALPADYLACIRGRIREIHEHGLAVVIDIHPEDPFKKQLAISDAAVSDFADFWGKLAAALAPFDPERTFFEVLNEPCLHNAARWNRVQRAAVAAIRDAAPRHTIIISGDRWSQLPELLKVEPPDDDNLIANFHLYDPSAFTHQGAGWASPWAMHIKGLSYPADPKAVAALLADVSDANARAQIDEYVAANWNARAYLDFLRPAVAWGRAHGLCLTCNEFGVYKNFAPRDSRLAWMRDVSAALTANGIGWTAWDYAGDFAVVIVKEDGSRAPDSALIAALGLLQT